MKRIFFLIFLLSFVSSALALMICGQELPEAPAGFDGATNGAASQSAVDAARSVFMEIRTPEEGLGPIYNEVSCVSCHQNQGVGGAAQTLEFRAGHVDGRRQRWQREVRHRFDTNGSSGAFVAATAVMANGTLVPNRSLINQRATCPDAQERMTDAENVRAARLSLPLFGDGFVEAVPDATLLALAKQNGGEAIQVPVVELSGVTAVGRFGWKDQHASLLSFAGDASVNELGMTNLLFPDESVVGVCASVSASAPEPNDTNGDINELATFMRTLKVPPRHLPTDATALSDISAGEALFKKIGCATCHTETLVTAPARTPILGGSLMVPAAIGGKQFHPFGDYLLHDIGTGDGIVQNSPDDTANKIRTMPLWGLSTRTQLMHDAKSATFTEAIQRHKNEAAGAERNFERLADTERILLFEFLGSL